MNKINPPAIDWANIAARFSRLRDTVGQFEILDDRDFRQAVVPLVPSKETLKYPLKLDYGYAFYPANPEQLELLQRMAWEFGFGPRWPKDPPTPCPELPLVLRIDKAITHREMSQSFLDDWAELHMLFGLYSGLLDQLPGTEAALRNRIDGWKDITLPQKEWFAFWIQAHAPEMRGRKRAEAEARLAELCFDIHEGKLATPDRIPVSWFEKMLEREDIDGQLAPGPNLKSTYRRLTASEIHDIVGNPLFGPEKLPPLSSAKFKKT